MVKGVERGVEIRSVHLVSKTGGKSGEWHRPDGGRPSPVRHGSAGPASASRAGSARSPDARDPMSDYPSIGPLPSGARALVHHGQ